MVNYLKLMCDQWMGNDVQPFLLYDVNQRFLTFEEEFTELFPVCGVEEPEYVTVASCHSVQAGSASAMPDSLESMLQLKRGDYQHLTDNQFACLQALLLEFRDVFASTPDDIGCVPDDLNVRHYIDIGDAKPVAQRPYKLSYKEMLFLKEEIKRLLHLGVIRPSCSPWMSPVVIVKKPHSDKLRLCIDFRVLNSKTLNPDPYQLPVIDQVHATMSGCKFFSAMDVVSGYWHVRVHMPELLGFTTPFGNFEWVRMPFGLVSAPATFQRLMDKMLAGVQGAKTYIDDTFAFTKAFAEHLVVLREVFTRCRRYHMKLNPIKCRFGVLSVKCLGHIISAEGIKPVHNDVEDILALPRPTTAKELKSFLGCVGWFRKCIKAYAHISAPLERLANAKVKGPLLWTIEAHDAFEQLKQALVSAPVLALPIWDQPFVLTTDWSKQAIGAMLSQVQPDTEEEHPIAYASRLLNAAERNYAPTEGECLALVWAVEKFRYYLHGHHFTVNTDHKALEWLNTARFTNSKLERWAMKLQEFDYKVQYIKGETNVVADYLSRGCGAAFCAEVVRNGMAVLSGCEDACSSDSVVLGGVWPGAAAKQSELDAIGCEICHDPGGFDNMAICSGCNRCFHLRCIMPPLSTVPSGDWYCPGCDPLHSNQLAELCDSQSPLVYAIGDPYLNEFLLAYVRSEFSDCILEELPAREAARVRKAASAFKQHPSIDGWLLVCKRIRGQGYRWLTCPPVSYRWDIIAGVHDALGHAGVEQVLRYMHQFYHWRGLKADIARYVKQCEACQKRKLVLPPLPELQEPVIHGPFDHVHIDLCGPFPTPIVDVHGQITWPKSPPKAWVVLMIDYFTKAAEFAVVYTKDPAAVARAFYYSWVCRYFVPAYITSDNGTEFNDEFVHLLKRLGITHIHTSVAHPAANGAVERLVKQFKAMLQRHINAHPQHWLQSVPVIRMQYMARLHSALGMSPHEMLFGRKPRLAMPLSSPFVLQAAASGVTVFPDIDPGMAQEHVQHLQQLMASFDSRVFDLIKQQFARNAAAWAKNRCLVEGRVARNQLHVGDLVLEIIDNAPTLEECAKGPFRIVGFQKDGAIAVLRTGATEFKHAREFTRHISKLARHFDKWSV